LLGLERPVDGIPVDRSNELDVDNHLSMQVNPIYPDVVSLMTPDRARAHPAAAVLVAALHGARRNIDMARIAIAAIQHLPEHQRHRYTATIVAALPEPQRTTLIEELPMNDRNPLWGIEKRSGTYQLGLSNGREEGRQEGRQEGRRATLIELILAVLEARGIAVDADAVAHILAEQALPTLERWALAAREVTQVAQLFELE
jgi:hypothetical protein